MALNIDLGVLQGNLFDAAEEAGRKYFDTSKDKYADYKVELRAYTDNLSVLKKELSEAPSELKEVKYESILLQQRSVNSLVEKYQMILVQEAAEQLKEVLKTVVITVGKIALSMAIAAV